VSGPRTAADERFERYLRDHDFAYRFEPDWAAEVGVVADAKPDYVIARDGLRAIAEVKGFTTDRLRRRFSDQRYGTLSDKEIFGPVRSAFADAARQLAPFASTGLPLIVVLANPAAADVFLDDWHVQHALIGNPAFSIPIDTSTGGAAGPGHWVATGYAVAIHEKSDHVSGVVVVHQREYATDWREAEAKKIVGEGEGFEAAADATLQLLRVAEDAELRGEIPTGSYGWAEVFELHDLHTPPPPSIPRRLFTHPRDRRFGIDPATGLYGSVELPAGLEGPV
jgi:hypothetical protein